MKNNIFIALFIVSIFGIFLLEDGMIRDFSISRFIQPFIFVSLPFMFAYFLGWKRGFVVSIAISFATAAYIWFLIGGRGEGWGEIYTAFFALFSVAYLVGATVFIAIADLFKNKKVTN